jgi:hypothetical protein
VPWRRCSSLEERESWVKTLQEEVVRFKPLREVFLNRREDTTPTERPLLVPDQPIAEGWMRKRGGVNTAWKRRYFVLYCDFDGGGNTLFYYINQEVPALPALSLCHLTPLSLSSLPFSLLRWL